MNLVTSMLIVVAFMMVVAIYQSRTEPFDLQLYIKRMLHLLIIVFAYFKDVGLCGAVKFRAIDWDLTMIT